MNTYLWKHALNWKAIPDAALQIPWCWHHVQVRLWLLLFVHMSMPNVMELVFVGLVPVSTKVRIRVLWQILFSTIYIILLKQLHKNTQTTYFQISGRNLQQICGCIIVASHSRIMKRSESIFIFGINICTMLSQVQYDRIVCITIVVICCSGAIYEWITESELFWKICKLLQRHFERLLAFPLHFIWKLFLEENVNSNYVWHQCPLFYPSPSELDAQCIATQFLCIKISVLYLHSYKLLLSTI